MLFNSTVFLFLFLPVTYFVFWALLTKNARFAWLTASGYVFYGYWNPSYCYLMAFATLVSYLAGLGFLRWGENPRARKLLLIVPIAIELGLLGYFKYADFSIGIINKLLVWQGGEAIPLLNILLPIGISFYVFHTITYIIDCYLEVITPTRNPLEFATYVSLFSQLVAGPIVRFSELEKDLQNVGGVNRRSFLNKGWSFFAIGLIQKVVIADSIALIIDPSLLAVERLSTVATWMCMLGYTYQIYFDFSGYSNMAVGLGLLFGLRIPQNFNSPYMALSPADFWRRWHMSLSRCFRDYLYLPWLGRRASKRRVAMVTLGTMTLVGLWHGANLNSVLFGAYHGLLLVLYNSCASAWDARPLWFRRALTFVLVVIGMTIFRAQNWDHTAVLFNRLFVWRNGTAVSGAMTLTFVLVIAGMIAHSGSNTFELSHEWSPKRTLALSGLFVVSLFFIYATKNSPFLYFQF